MRTTAITRPKDIERALAGDIEPDGERRNLQLEAAAHVRVQAEVDRLAATGALPEPASRDLCSPAASACMVPDRAFNR